MRYKACPVCGLIHQLPPLPPHQQLCCVRCGSRIQSNVSARHRAAFTAATALAALFLFWPAMLLPVLEVNKVGYHYQSSILMGTLQLLEEGQWFVGGIVLVFSIIFPLIKLLLLLELSLFGIFQRSLKTATFRLMYSLGKWSMLDVLLLAYLVMLVKLGELVRFEIGPAAFAFTLCVILSMIASISFDPDIIWEQKPPVKNPTKS